MWPGSKVGWMQSKDKQNGIQPNINREGVQEQSEYGIFSRDDLCMIARD